MLLASVIKQGILPYEVLEPFHYEAAAWYYGYSMEYIENCDQEKLMEMIHISRNLKRGVVDFGKPPGKPGQLPRVPGLPRKTVKKGRALHK